MAYLVKLMPRAERDLTNFFGAKNVEHSDAAWSWYLGLRGAVLSLEEQPHCCPETAESSKFRHLLYGNKPHFYRIIYRILEREKIVEVVHIRHGARKKFTTPTAD